MSGGWITETSISHLLPVGRHSILVGVNRNGVHGQFMGSTEYSNGDFLEKVV